MRTLFFLFLCACACTSQSYGQPGWQFTRQNDSGVHVTAADYPQTGFDVGFDFDQAAGDNLVNISTNASAMDPDPPGSAFAQATSMAQAMNLTPVGAVTFAPTVDVTISHADVADVVTSSSPKFATSRFNADGGVSAASYGSYMLDGTPASGFLHGSMNLLGIIGGTETGDADYLGGGFVQAVVGDYFVEAAYSHTADQWGVEVNLPNIVDSFFTPSLNFFFTFSVPITLPSSIDIEAHADTLAKAEAGRQGQDGSAQGQVHLSASAWAVFTPSSSPPPDGDFDGDLDVDGSDFLAFQRGRGETFGATLSQGDANHDGNVDSADLALWEGSFGTMSPSSLPAALVAPEPSTLTIATLAILLAFSPILSFRVP